MNAAETAACFTDYELALCQRHSALLDFSAVSFLLNWGVIGFGEGGEDWRVLLSSILSSMSPTPMDRSVGNCHERNVHLPYE